MMHKFQIVKINFTMLNVKLPDCIHVGEYMDYSYDKGVTCEYNSNRRPAYYCEVCHKCQLESVGSAPFCNPSCSKGFTLLRQSVCGKWGEHCCNRNYFKKICYKC